MDLVLKMEAQSIFYVLDGLEERVQRLESIAVDISKVVAENRAVLLGIKDQMQTLNDLMKDSGEHSNRLRRLEDNQVSNQAIVDSQKQNRKEFWMKVGINVVSGILGAALAMGAAWLQK